MRCNDFGSACSVQAKNTSSPSTDPETSFGPIAAKEDPTRPICLCYPILGTSPETAGERRLVVGSERLSNGGQRME